MGECYFMLSVVMLSVIMLGVVILNVTYKPDMLNVIMLNVDLLSVVVMFIKKQHCMVVVTLKGTALQLMSCGINLNIVYQCLCL